MDSIRYIIVVHGIGEQRKNETVLSVVNRFAEARRGWSSDKKSNTLTLGRATGQTGKDDFLNPCRYPISREPFPPWMEFEGIPQVPNGNPTDPFYGERSKSGNNLRFVDLCWSDIMQSDWPHVGQKTEIWAKSLLGRLRKNYTGKAQFTWVLVSFEKLVETLLLVKKLMSFRIKKMEDLIFNKFLGDVQLYGEFFRTRGKAVRRFHKLIARVERKHQEIHGEKVKAHYTVIAHSLGSIMSYDALTYAHVDQAIRQDPNHIENSNLPFPGYCQENPEQIQAAKDKIKQLEEKNQLTPQEKDELEVAHSKIDYLNTDWVKRVDSFVTLGSPIDKYLILWWLNYKYLDATDWCEDERWKEMREKKIPHLNYCDEQDPVGHELDEVEKRPAYQKIFHKKEDRVFNRYPIPGAAHNEYWEDLNLFKRILNRAVDNPEANQPPTNSFTWFDKDVYSRVLKINYKIIPWVIVFADYFVFTWAMYAEKKHIAGLASLIALAVWYLGRQVIDLLIYWRQILMAKSQKRWEKETPSKDYQDRESQRQWFRWRLKWVSALNLTLAGISLGIYLRFLKNHLMDRNIVIFLIVLIPVVLVWKFYLNFKKTEEDADQIQRKESVWDVDGKVIICLLLSVLLAYGVSTFGTLIGFLEQKSTHLAMGMDEIKFVPHFWFNLTAFFMISGTVFTYQYFRHQKARQDLGLNGKQKKSSSNGETTTNE
jgi:hypothetical protein